MERQISIRLTVRVVKEIDRRARRCGRRRSDLVREALDIYLDMPDGVVDSRLGDRIGHLIGSVKGLPPDLASEPRKYMEGFGRGRR